eukprot:scaffold8820_cov63-Phaeocystis_antarctica.AAC.2
MARRQRTFAVRIHACQERQGLCMRARQGVVGSVGRLMHSAIGAGARGVAKEEAAGAGGAQRAREVLQGDVEGTR